MKLFLSVITLSMVTGCVTHIAPYERKERHYEPDNYANENGGRSVGSLWGDASSSFFEDVRARRVGDIITIVIEESANAARGASTKASSDSSAEAGVTALFGALAKIVEKNPNITPEQLLGYSSSSSFDGKGSTSRSGTLSAVLPVRIKRKLPNGDFYLEGNKVVLVNDEESFLYMSGVVRPMDIAPDNSVLSSRVADVELEYTGRGVIADRQSPGWFSGILNKIWPL